MSNLGAEKNANHSDPDREGVESQRRVRFGSDFLDIYADPLVPVNELWIIPKSFNLYERTNYGIHR
jgi:hypothetical protein